MRKKITLFFVSLFCFSSLIVAKKSLNILTEASTITFQIIGNEACQVSAIDSQYLDTTLTQETAILNTEIKSINNIIKGLLFSKGWAIGLNYGLTQFRGDIKESGFLKSSSFSNSYSLEIEKQINPQLRISTEVVIGN